MLRAKHCPPRASCEPQLREILHGLQVQLLQQKAQAAEAAALNAETVASAAMSAAESAVREEMEAAAVAKSTATALNSVLGELRALGVSFETTDKLERSLEAKGVSKVHLPHCQCLPHQAH